MSAKNPQIKNMINELVDKYGNLYTGDKNEPEHGPNLNTQAKNTTDHNIKVSRQHYSDDFLGLFGFYYLEQDGSPKENIIQELAELEFERFKELYEFFIKNLSKENLKKWSKLIKKDFKELSDEESKTDYKWAKRIFKTFIKVLKKNSKENDETKQINENDLLNSVVEDVLSKYINNDLVSTGSYNDLTSDFLYNEVGSVLDNYISEKGELTDEEKENLINLIQGK